MYSKKTNTIFTVGIIAVIVILLLLTINMEKLSVDENGSETTTISEGNESGTKSADDMLIEEATKYMQEANVKRLSLERRPLCVNSFSIYSPYSILSL